MKMELNEQNFQAEVIEAKEPVLVDFWAPWCGPCRMVAPIIEEIATDYSGKLKVAKINVDDNQALASRFNVMSIPTICLFVNGAVATQWVGLRQKKEFTSVIEKHLA